MIPTLNPIWNSRILNWGLSRIKIFWCWYTRQQTQGFSRTSTSFQNSPGPKVLFLFKSTDYSAFSRASEHNSCSRTLQAAGRFALKIQDFPWFSRTSIHFQEFSRTGNFLSLKSQGLSLVTPRNTNLKSKVRCRFQLLSVSIPPPGRGSLHLLLNNECPKTWYRWKWVA